MPRPELPTCPWLGPHLGHPGRPSRPLPPDYDTHPFKYLPPRITLSAEDLELARKYENGDFSGGYLTSQIAHFRRPLPEARHRERREQFRQLRERVDAAGLVLPGSFVELIETDDYVDRLRHNTIWPLLPEELVPLPSDPDRTLFLIFGEGQGCGFWHLLLAPDGGHVVAFSEHAFGLDRVNPPGCGRDLASFAVYRCSDSFNEWIVRYFAACVEADRHYEERLAEHRGA